MEHDHKLRLMHCVALVILALVLAGCGAGSSRSNRSLVHITGILQVHDDQLGTIGAASASSRDAFGQRWGPASYSSSSSIASSFSDLSQDVPREWIVGVHPGVTLDELRAWLAPFGVVPLREIYGADAWVVAVPGHHSDPEGLMDQVLRQIPQLTYAEPNLPVRVLAFEEPNDPLFLNGDQWNLRTARLPEAWAQVKDWMVQRSILSPEPVVRVAILDTGICREHEDLNDDNLWDEAFSFSAVPGLGPFKCSSAPPDDLVHHGTQVASIIAAITNNGKGMAGTFWDPYGDRQVKLIAARVLDDDGRGDLASVINAIHTLVRLPAPPHIISMSFGHPTFSTPLQEAVRDAHRAGIVLVAAAGNRGSVEYPAAYSEVLAVGSTDWSNARAGGSGQGSALDLMAPGEGVRVAVGYSNYTWNRGTSFSAPLVTGIAALLVASGVNDPQEVRDLLLFTARSVQGRFDKTRGHSTEYGWGLVDAAAALRLGAAPKVFLARQTDDRLIRVAASVQLAPNGAFRIEPQPRDEDLWVVGWVDVDRDLAVSSGDFFVQRQVRPASGQAINLGTLTAEPYVGQRIPVELH